MVGFHSYFGGALERCLYVDICWMWIWVRGGTSR